MEALKVDNELSEYWPRLNVVQKESIMRVIKHIVEPEEQYVIPQEHIDKIMKEREDYLNGIGETYSWEEAREYIVNKHKANNVSD